MFIKSGILLKNLVLSYAKILYHTFILTIYEKLKSVFFFTYLGQTAISKLVCLFDLSNWKN